MEQEDVRPASGPGETAVAIDRGRFAWEEGGGDILADVSLRIATNQLVIVVGEVSHRL